MTNNFPSLYEFYFKNKNEYCVYFERKCEIICKIPYKNTLTQGSEELVHLRKVVSGKGQIILTNAVSRYILCVFTILID